MFENKNIDIAGNEEVQNSDDTNKDISVNVHNLNTEQLNPTHCINTEEEKCEKKNISEDVKDTLENTRIAIILFYEKALEKIYALIKKVKVACLKAYSFLKSKVYKRQEGISHV